MINKDKEMMDKYGITSKPKMYYFYRHYRYDQLNDALSYAKIDANRIHGNRR